MYNMKKQDLINYPLIPISDITPEARRIAVQWMEGFEEWMKTDVPHKHKLASDIMNYAKNIAEKTANDRLAQAEKFLDSCEQLQAEGAVYSQSGYYPHHVTHALKIAAGIE